MIEGLITPRTTDMTRMNLDPMDARGRNMGLGVGMTSSRPSSPMLRRQSSKVDVRRED